MKKKKKVGLFIISTIMTLKCKNKYLAINVDNHEAHLTKQNTLVNETGIRRLSRLYLIKWKTLVLFLLHYRTVPNGV
jgi:hypothetical protein